MYAAIQVVDLTVRRGRATVLNDLTCSISGGAITGLLGPSGAGKTTLMRCLVGVQQILAGTVTVLGLDAGAPDLRHRVGYVTQAPSIYADLTVVENVRYFAALTDAGHDAAHRALDDVGLTGFADRLVRNLSGGQWSRASLACALVADPDVYILDEPTVGQDPVLREELWNLFRAKADAGATIVVSSHVMDEANRCDRLLLIRDGELLADETPAAIKAAAGTDDMDRAFLTLIRNRDATVGRHAAPTSEFPT